MDITLQILMGRFPELSYKQIRSMLKPYDIRNIRLWREIREEIKAEHEEEGAARKKQRLVQSLHARGRTFKEIAELLAIPLTEVRRLARAD